MPIRKLAAIMFTDISGFSERMRSDENAAMRMIHHHNAVMDSSARRYHGTVMKSIGDSCLVMFGSAVDAVECAVDAQKRFSRHNETTRTEEDRLRIRMSIHIGEILLEGQDVFGDGVDIASRLQSVSKPGQICISQDVYALTKSKVSRRFFPMGSFRFKGVTEPIEFLVDWLPPGAPEPKPAAAPPEQEVLFRRPKHHGITLDAPQQVEPPARRTDREERPAEEAPPPEPAPKAQTEPITDVLLLVGHPALLLSRVAGLTTLERQVFTLAKAGVRRVQIAARKPEGIDLKRHRWPEGVEVKWIASDFRGEPFEPPYAAVSADYFIRHEALKGLLTASHDRHTSYQDSQRRGVVQILPYRKQTIQEYDKKPMPRGACVLLESPLHSKRYLPWLKREVTKTSDSFMARHFDRKLSLAVTVRLLDTRVKPNHMTVFSTLIGIAGAALFSLPVFVPQVPARWVFLAGAFVFWLHTVLDGCDGELARLRHQSSRLGGILDFWGDNVVHFALFACMGWGLAARTGAWRWLALGLAAAVSAVASALLVYRHSVQRARREKADGPLFRGLDDLADERGGSRSLLAKVEHVLSQRDFVYLVLLLAALDRLDLFLWAAGIGTPLFLAVLILIRKKS